MISKEDLIIYSESIYFGLKTKAGERIIKPVLDDVKLKERYIEIVYEGKIGLINYDLEVLIEPELDKIEEFEDGYAKIIKEKRYGLINKEGKIIAKPKYGKIYHPQNGLIRFRKMYEAYLGFLDLNGKEIISARYIHATDFADGLSGVSLRGHWGDEGMYEIVQEIGYINEKDKLVIVPREFEYGYFQKINAFKNGLCKIEFVNLEKNCVEQGYIDTKGKEVVKVQYVELKGPYDNILLAKKNDRWGIIDLEDRLIVKFIYEDLIGPYNGIYLAKKNGKWGIIDQNGVYLIKHIIDDFDDSHLYLPFDDFDNLEYPPEDTDLFPMRSKGKWGCINLLGELVIPFKYSDYQFSGVYSNDFYFFKKRTKWGAVDKKNKEVIPFLYDGISHYDSLNEIVSVMKRGKWGYINMNGREIISIKYDFVCSNDNGIVRVEKNKKRGYLSIDGNVIAPMIYSNVEQNYIINDISFSDTELVKIKYNDRLGLLGKDGRIIVKPIYDELKYWEGFWRFAIGKKHGFLDKEGIVVKNTYFEDAKDFSEKLAAVKNDGLWGFVDEKLNLIVPYQYEEVKSFWNWFAAIKENGLWGFINRKGVKIIECKYDSVNNFNEGLAKVEYDNVEYYIDVNGKETQAQFVDDLNLPENYNI